MKIYGTQAEVEADVKDGVLDIQSSVRFDFDLKLMARIRVSGDITGWDITAKDIKAWNITAGNVTARDIMAVDIAAGNITARDIVAGNITARDITARNISYYALLLAYEGIKCKSWTARRKNHADPICLDGKLEIVK